MHSDFGELRAVQIFYELLEEYHVCHRTLVPKYVPDWWRFLRTAASAYSLLIYDMVLKSNLRKAASLTY